MDNQEQQPLLPPPLPQPFTPPQHSPQNAAKPPTSRRTDFSPNDGNPNNHSLYLTAPTATPLATQSSTAQSATASPGHSALTCHKSPRPPAHPFTSDPHKIAPIEKIPYDIHAFSSHSPAYHPRNILEDKPSDQSSRWSSGTNDHMQYITIKLEKMAIVHSITFGKFHKVHVCNLKEFRVYGGLTPDSMTELLHNGLRNDPNPETFALKHRTNNVIFPIQYIKIVPLMAWGQNFNFSIWYIELQGVLDTEVLRKVHQDFVNYCETESIRLCLKHFRQRNFTDAFGALQERTGVTLEGPLLTDLHRALVAEGDFDAAEDIMRQATQQDLFREYIQERPYKPVWKRIWAANADGDSPCMRGGHQMCMDVDAGMIYLLGGWNGREDLADFWCFDVNERTWRLISLDTEKQGGPGPRSCHKICFDPRHRQIYVFGRYVDTQSRSAVNLDPDFYRYDVVHDIWCKISGHTARENGPELIYDHQMCVDPETQTLYVFGGRTVHSDSSLHRYSGLYAYHIPSNEWRLVRNDMQPTATTTPTTPTTNPAPPAPPAPPTPDHPHLRSRIGHSMLFDPSTRLLYIFAGQRFKDYLSDFYAYDLDQDRVIELSRDYSKQGGPDAGFTQRATIDIETGEFYVLSGLMKEKGQETVKNSFWVYDVRRDRWRCVYQNENLDPEYWRTMGEVEPCPRFAHQLVYDSVHKVQYLFGGNPGDSQNMTKRLDDFWELHLMRPKAKDVLRRCLFHIRAQRFTEMCTGGAVAETALTYLQTDLSAVVDHENDVEGSEFRRLTAWLVQRKAKADEATAREEAFQARTRLFERLLEFFPESMTQPKGNLIDVVPFVFMNPDDGPVPGRGGPVGA